jgi:hypothetical protein
MKLYTEEQVRDCMSKSFAEGVCFGAAPMYKNESFDEIIKLQCPIELPSDEEIQAYFKKGYGGDDGSAIYGAKWMKEQILKQDKQ